MSNIVFCYPPIVSTINSSFLLARELESIGHNVFYLGVLDCEAIVISNGFRFFSIFERWFPKRSFDEFYFKMQRKGEQGNAKYREISTHFNEFIDYLISGGDSDFFEIVDKLSPDLAIVSTSLSDSVLWALFLHKYKVKTIYAFDVLGGSINHTVPPVSSSMIANEFMLARIKIILSWIWFFIRNSHHQNYLKRNGLTLITKQNLKRVAAYCGYPFQDIRFYTDMPGPQLSITEMVFFPYAFEFKGVSRKSRVYVEASIDINRKQNKFPWNAVRNDKPTIYVALGSLLVLEKSDYENFFRMVIDASKKWVDWNWVISIGNELCINAFSGYSNNVVIVNNAPQLDLLKRADLMITHAGPNSIKECIYFGVPMILFPLFFDQEGNAARAVYHGLGVRGSFKEITSEGLQKLIAEVFYNESYKNNINRMRSLFEKKERAKLSIKLIEDLLISN